MAQENNRIMQSQTDVLSVSDSFGGHQYRGIAPIQVDNLFDTVSIDPNSYQSPIHAGDNIDINTTTNVISVTNKRKLVVDAPLYKEVSDDEVHLGINGQGYVYSAGKNMQLTNNVFACNGNSLDYGSSNTLSGTQNYVIGVANSVYNDEGATPNIVLGTNNNISGHGLNFTLGNINSQTTNNVYSKTYTVGRANTLSSSETAGYGAYAFGCGLTAEDNEVLIGLPTSRTKYSDKIYNYGTVVNNGQLYGLGNLFTYGNSNTITNERRNTFVLGTSNTINDDGSSANKGTNIIAGLSNNTSGNGYNNIIGDYNIAAADYYNSKNFIFGHSCSAFDTSVTDNRMGSYVFGYNLQANTNEMNIGFPNIGIKLAEGKINLRRNGVERTIGTVQYSDNATFDTATNTCTITFDSPQHIEYGTLMVQIMSVTSATNAVIRLYNNSNEQIIGVNSHIEEGTYIVVTLPFVNGTPAKVEILNDNTVTTTPGAITGEIYAYIKGIEL